LAAGFLERTLANVGADRCTGTPWQAHGSATIALEQSSARATELTHATHERTTTVPFFSRRDPINMVLPPAAAAETFQLATPLVHQACRRRSAKTPNALIVVGS
jgi:hypothetical protein